VAGVERQRKSAERAVERAVRKGQETVTLELPDPRSFRRGLLFSARGSELVELLEPRVSVLSEVFAGHGYRLMEAEEVAIAIPNGMGQSWTPAIRVTFVLQHDVIPGSATVAFRDLVQEAARRPARVRALHDMLAGLEALRRDGTIADAEYRARRTQIAEELASLGEASAPVGRSDV
jgi:hypothetical protein